MSVHGVGGGEQGLCECTTVSLSCFVAVMDSHEIKGRLEAANLAACSLKN